MDKDLKRVIIQVALFITTFITTTLSGTWWVSGKYVFGEDFMWSDFVTGLYFSIPFLLILTVHEFGHYFMAMYHKVKATLPYYIPLPPLPLMIGTMGAVIRLQSRVPSKKENFDIGLAGPLAGFVMAFFVLLYGFATLPPAEYIFEIHPEYKSYGLDYAQHVYAQKENIVDITIGKNLLFQFFEYFVADPSRMPNPHEIMHYPILFGGYLALVFTFLNLMPIGQLDGGHVLYGLAGFKKHRIIASIFFVGFMFYAGLGNEYIDPKLPFQQLLPGVVLYPLFLYFAFTGLKLGTKDTIMYALIVFAAQFLWAFLVPGIEGYSGWMVFGFIVGKFVGIPHPPCEIEEPLDSKRIILGWVALLIFILCFSPAPIVIK
jgi:membrane-associated protease RseP (regulator of RpoE activity)